MTESRPRVTAAITVDLVVLTVRGDRLHVLLIERGTEPYAGQPALPGGFLRDREDLLDSAIRELREETSLDGRRLHLEQLGAYAAADRDPRGRVLTVAYLAIAPNLPQPAAGTDAAGAVWMPADRLLGPDPVPLAFDHAAILRDGIERARVELEYTTVAAAFCKDEFTITELRTVYEAVWGTTVDPRNFARKVLTADGFVVPTGHKRASEMGRPAALYRRGDALLLNPPMLRAQSMARRRPSA
jgi:8-oxo-dGTP diphosphatase